MPHNNSDCNDSSCPANVQCLPGPQGTAETITVRRTITSEPGTMASVKDVAGGPNHVLDFTIPRGAAGASDTPAQANFLYVTNAAAQTPVDANTVLTFDAAQVQSGIAIIHTAGSGNIRLTEPGVYKVTFSVAASDAAGATAPVIASVQLDNNGKVVPGSVSTATVVLSGSTLPLSGTVLLPVTNTSTLTLVTSSTEATFTNASVVVQKLN